MLIAQISDTHIKPDGRLAYERVDTALCLARAVEHVRRLAPAPEVVLLTGDLVDAGLEEEYVRLRGLLAPLPMPVYVIPGNHDAREPLRRVFGVDGYLPREGDGLQYVIETHPVRLIGLDTLVPGQGGGRLGPRRLDWLEARLAEAPARPTLVFMHHPPFRTGLEAMDAQWLEDGEALGAVIRRHAQVEGVLCGHVHRPIHARWCGTVVTTAPSSAHAVHLDLRQPGGFAWVMEPPACLLHLWRPGVGLVSHLSHVGDFAGPYPFHGSDGRLLD
jgi:3',5'-cyclic AMP phosphodiesterase CpdA